MGGHSSSSGRGCRTHFLTHVHYLTFCACDPPSFVSQWAIKKSVKPTSYPAIKMKDMPNKISNSTPPVGDTPLPRRWPPPQWDYTSGQILHNITWCKNPWMMMFFSVPTLPLNCCLLYRRASSFASLHRRRLGEDVGEASLVGSGSVLVGINTKCF